MPVNPTRNKILALCFVKSLIGDCPWMTIRMMNRTLAIKNRKKPIVSGGAIATKTLAETHEPPQKNMARTRAM